LNCRVIFFWATDKPGVELATSHNIHLEDLEELILVMVDAQGAAFLRFHVVNLNFPKPSLTTFYEE
jgi:hypothetical protein